MKALAWTWFAAAQLVMLVATVIGWCTLWLTVRTPRRSIQLWRFGAAPQSEIQGSLFDPASGADFGDS